jgi:hypothetical protein
MVDRQGNVAIGEELDQVVDVLQRRAAGGHDDRLARGGDLFDQDPVVEVGTGELDDLDAEVVAQVDRRFVKGRGHRDAAALADRCHQNGIFVPCQAGVEGFLDIADVIAFAKVLVDKGVGIAELQLDRGAHVVETHDAGKVGDDSQAALDPPPVVVGEF